MQSPPPQAAPAFAPLPLRARSVLETLDIAVKVYKQYFWVLLGWSVTVIALTGVGSLVALVVPFGGVLPSAMLTPLITGVVSCCIAAAVRGQRVEFRQCWQFTRPRFWPMVGYYLLAVIICGLILGVVMLAAGLLVAGAVAGLGSAPQAVQVIIGILGGVILLTLVTMAATVVVTWHYLVPVVVCMEEDKQNSQALKRAYEILRRQWVQVCTLMTLVSLGLAVLALILLATWALLIGLPTVEKAFTGHDVAPSQWWMMGIGAALSYLGIWVVAKPIFHLILVLFYFDVRIRQEALDLEWAAHVTAPTYEATLNPAPASVPGELQGFTSPGYAVAPPTDPYNVVTTAAPPAAPTGAPTAPESVSPPQGVPPPQAPADVLAAPEPSLGPEIATTAPATAPPAPAPTDEIRCPQCGAPTPASHVFCMRCGTRIKPPPAAAPGAPPQW